MPGLRRVRLAVDRSTRRRVGVRTAVGASTSSVRAGVDRSAPIGRRRRAGRFRAVRTLRRPLRVLALLAVVVVVATGCRVQLETTVDIGLDGKGTITQGIGFDDAALKRVGDPALALRAQDLVDAGWVVDPVVEEGDLTWVRVHHDFTTPEQANALMAQLSGPDGPYRDLEVIRTSGPLSDSVRFSGVMDTSAGLAMFGDKALSDALGGDASGGLLSRIEKEEGRPPAEMVELDMRVDVGGTTRTWTASLGDPGQQTMKVSGSRSKLLEVVGTAFVVLLVVGTIAVIALRVRARRRRTRRIMRPSTRRW